MRSDSCSGHKMVLEDRQKIHKNEHPVSVGMAEKNYTEVVWPYCEDEEWFLYGYKVVLGDRWEIYKKEHPVSVGMGEVAWPYCKDEE